MSAISTMDPRLTPATPGEIEDALRLLCNSLRAPEGVDNAVLLVGYRVALEGYPRWAIANAARRFVRGEVPGQSKSFCPRPPELADAVRTEVAPLHRQIEREAMRARNGAEAAEFAPVHRTPEARSRGAAIYAKFCAEQAEQQKHVVAPSLDPALVEHVPDAPTTWERLKWERRGGDRG